MSDQPDLACELTTSVIKHLEAKEYSTALELFDRDKHREYLIKHCWNLIPVLSRNLTNDMKIKNEGMLRCSEQILEIFANEGNPDEGFLEFLEQIEEGDEVKFVIILKLLQVILFRNLRNQANCLEWCLNSMRTYFENVPVPECDGRVTSLNPDNIVNMTNILTSVLSFYQSLSQICNSESNKETEKIRLLLLSRLIQMHDIYFPYIDEKSTADVQAIQNQIMELILKLNPNPCSLLEHVFYRSLNVMKPKKPANPVNFNDYVDNFEVHENVSVFEDEQIISDLSYGVFFFTLLAREPLPVQIPLIYNPKYVFLSLIYVTVPFLEKSNDVLMHKGLIFLDFLLNQLHEELLKCDLYFSSHKSILIALNNAMIFSECKENRTDALKCFRKYILNFNWEARYLLLYRLRDHIEHSGTLGYLITMLKDFIVSYLSLPPESKTYRKYLKYYRGKLLFDIIKKYCFLSHNVQNDLVQSADHVISSLNFLRFLILRDKNNVTDVKNFIKKIHGDFLKPLQEQIKLSKANYDMTLKDLEKEGSHEIVDDDKFLIKVKDCPLPKLTKEEQKKACLCALNAVDLIQSLLSRVVECIQETYSLHF